MAAGAGYDAGALNAEIADLARVKLSLNARAARVRKWLDRISANADPAIVATALVVKTGQSATDARKVVDTINEISFHEASFAPTHTLDVSGPTF